MRFLGLAIGDESAGVRGLDVALAELGREALQLVDGLEAGLGERPSPTLHAAGHVDLAA